MASFAEAIPEQPQPEKHYDPRFITPFATRVIELEGRKIEIHRTNSLPGIIESVIAREINEEPDTIADSAYRERVAREPVIQQAVLGFLAEETEVVLAVRDILDVRAIEKNATPLWLVEVETHSAQPTSQETSDEEPIRDYYFSLAFDQIAARARAIDPNFDLLKFVE